MKTAGRKTGIVNRVITSGLPIRILPAVCLMVSLLLPAAPAAARQGAGLDLKLNGFIEWESFVNSDTDQNFKDSVKKNEIHGRLETTYGPENFYLFMRSDLYLQPDFLNSDESDAYRYAAEGRIARNLRFSGQNYDWAFDELYLNYMISPWRLRFGNQIFHWGTADVFNPTAYFNPYDFREFIFHDDDELQQGIPACAAMYFADDFTAELVFTFVHVPMQIAPEESFWSLNIDRSLYTISVEPSDGLAATMGHTGQGARISTNLLNADISFSLYHGPDREPVQRPVTIDFQPNRPLNLVVEQYFEVVTMAGIDFSKAIGDFVFQFEGVYSPDKPNIVMQTLNTPADIRLPFEIRKSDYISYAAGFNYYLPLEDYFEDHTGEALFTLDWFQSRYFDDALADPALSDILTLRFQDGYLDGRINIKLTAMFETRHNGMILWPKIQYDFQNGWTADLGYAAIDGDLDGLVIDPLFYHFRDNDIAMLKVRYAF